MQLLSVSGLPKHLTWNQSLGVEKLGVKVKMGSNEQIVATDWAVIYLYVLPRTYTAAQVKAMDIKPPNLVGRRYRKNTAYGSYDAFQFDMTSCYITSSISKGATKTISVRDDDDGNTTLDWFSTPHTTDRLGPSQTYQTVQAYIRSSGYLTDQKHMPVTIAVNVCDDRNHDYYAVINTNYYFQDTYDTPAITGTAFSDASPLDPLSEFGGFVRTKSMPVFSSTFTVDTDDPGLTAEHTLVLKFNGTERARYTAQTASGATSVSIDLGVLETYADRWQYTVRDSQGNTISTTGAFTELQYYDPEIHDSTAGPLLERYRMQGGEPVADPLGELVRISVHPYAVGLDGSNACKCRILWEDEGVAHAETIAETDDGMDVELRADTGTLEDYTFSVGRDWNFTFELTDYFHPASSPVTLNVLVEKGDGVFDITEHGVAVGQLSTATQNAPKFESKHPAYLYGGIREGGLNYVQDEEIPCGKWVDGKTIYRKTIYKASISGAAEAAQVTVCSLSSLHIDRLIRYEANMKQSNGTLNMVPTWYSATNFKTLYIDGSANLILRHAEGSTSRSNSLYVTLYYTKTTT